MENKKLSDICIEAKNKIGRGVPGDAINAGILVTLININEGIQELIKLLNSDKNIDPININTNVQIKEKPLIKKGEKTDDGK